jgi:hypothetical protein
MELRTGGPLVAPGVYQIKLTVAGKDRTAPLEVKADPRGKASQADLEKQFEFAAKIRDRVSEIHDTVNQIHAARAKLEAERNGASTSKTQAIDAVEQKMATIEEQLIQVRSVNFAAALVFPIMLDAQYADLGNAVESADSAPPEQTYEMFKVYEQKREEQFARWKSVQEEIAKIGN